jgi:hypothetical protein
MAAGRPYVVSLIVARSSRGVPVHPTADMWPEMSDDELVELGKDIEEHGLQQPIVLLCNGATG